MALSQSVLKSTLLLSNKTLAVGTSAELKTVCLELLQLTGLRGIILGAAISSDNNDLLTSHLYSVGVAEGWLKYYNDNGWATSDPVVDAVMETGDIMTWADAIEWSQQHCRYHQCMDEFREVASSCGLKFGYAIGKKAHAITQTLACTTVTHDQPISDDVLEIMDYMLPHLNEVLVRPGFIPTPELSKREVEVLGWAKVGKSNWETSQILNISERTVKFHLENSYKKLKVANRSQAVARAMQLGVIRFDSGNYAI